MKRYPLILTFFFTLFLSPAFAQVKWQWYTMGDFNTYQDGWAIATDKSNNIYLTGQWSNCPSSIDTTLVIGATKLTMNSINDVADFLLKVDGNGKPQWLRGSNLADSIYSSSFGVSVATDRIGNIYETGQYGGTIFFNTNKLNTNGLNCFLVKYDNNGNVLWAKAPTSITVLQHNSGWAVTTDKLNNIYLAGSFLGNIQFGTHVLNGSSSSLFLVKYDPSGNVIWAKTAIGNITPGINSGSLGLDNNMSLTTDKENHIYLAGSFDSTVITLGGHTLNNLGATNIFLVKYDTAGNVIWARSAGGAQNDYANKVTTDNTGNVYIDGTLGSHSVSFSGKVITNSKPSAFFIAKYDTAGNNLWAKASGSSTIGYSLTVDSCDYVFASGSCDTALTIDSLVYPIPVNSKDDSFYLRFDSTGKVLNGFVFSSGGDDQNGIATDTLGNIIMGGDFEFQTIIGTDTIPAGCFETADIMKFTLGEACTDTTIPPPPPPVQKCVDFTVPNVFTPNGDNQNDFFVINAIMDTYTIDIYDRWGLKEFHATSPSISWNGRNPSGEIVPDGVYYYIIRATCEGKNFDKKGFVQVLK